MDDNRVRVMTLNVETGHIWISPGYYPPEYAQELVDKQNANNNGVVASIYSPTAHLFWVVCRELHIPQFGNWLNGLLKMIFTCNNG